MTVVVTLDLQGEGDTDSYELAVEVDEDGDCGDIVSATVLRAVTGLALRGGIGRYAYAPTPLRGTELTEEQLENISTEVQWAYTEERRGARISREYGGRW